MCGLRPALIQHQRNEWKRNRKTARKVIFDTFDVVVYMVVLPDIPHLQALRDLLARPGDPAKTHTASDEQGDHFVTKSTLGL